MKSDAAISVLVNLQIICTTTVNVQNHNFSQDPNVRYKFCALCIQLCDPGWNLI